MMEADKVVFHVSNLSLSFRLNDLIKRLIDVVFSALVLILLAPFLGLIAWAIKRDSPGPAFYRGARIGRGGKPFYILKFRTMYEQPGSYQGPKVTAQDDPRVTPLGRWLRNTKLNELPQFWNVLKGEMSLVGPRPEDPTIASSWPKEVWEEVLSVRPGITSPASVQYRDEENRLSIGSVMQKYFQELSPDKTRLDRLYVRYRSFWLDLDTLLWTALLLMPRLCSYTPLEGFLFVGPITRLIRRHLSWFTIDLLVTFAAISVTGLVWRASGPLNIGWPMAFGMAVGFALLFSLCGAVSGVNRVKWSEAVDADVFDLLPPWILATVLATIFNFWMNHFPIEMVLAAALLALLGFIVTRYRMRLIAGFLNSVTRHRAEVQAARERFLIVGSGPTAQLVSWLLARPETSYLFRLVGFIDDDLLKQGMRIYGSEVIGTQKDICRLVEKYDIGVIMLADHNPSSEDKNEIIHMCQSTSARLVVLPDIFGLLHGLSGAAPHLHLEEDSGNGRVDSTCLHCLAQLMLLDQDAGLEASSNLEEMSGLRVVHAGQDIP